MSIILISILEIENDIITKFIHISDLIRCYNDIRIIETSTRIKNRKSMNQLKYREM